MRAKVPMFPLPNFFLFPGTVEPLHVFEPRYREMIDDQLDGRGRLVMGTILEDHLDGIADSPPVFHVGGLGEIVQHRRLPDGRYVIMLQGLSRVTIEEAPSDRLYRMVHVEELSEIPPTDSDAARLEGPLRLAIAERAGADNEIPDEFGVSRLADVMVQLLPLPQSTRQELFAELDVAARAQRVLAEHDALG